MRAEYLVPGQPQLSHSAHAVRASGELLFVNGVLPIDADSALVGGDDIVAQARRVFESMGEILAAAGASFADVVKLTIFLTDVDERPAIAPLREQVFGAARPASTLVGVSGLAVPGARIEAECVAVLP
jgi:enamine deaminase RidA (YjgF/YER057c/UK114 family)